MKIAFIPSSKDPYSKHSWSGTDYYTRKALEDQGNEVYCIYGYDVKPSIKLKLRKVIERIKGYTYDVRRSWEASKIHAQNISKNILPGTDAVFALGTIKIAELETNLPIYILVDSIYEMHRKWYGYDGSRKTNDECNAIEREALKKCTKVISCSKETGNFIQNFYGIPSDKIEIVPLGANWDKEPDRFFVKEKLEIRLEQDVCKLLFVGVEWERKGADIVLNTLKELNKRNFPVELAIVGLKDIPEELPENAKNYGFISKNTDKGIAMLDELFSSSHFLFVPSIAEAYGLVFCEANAYAVPCISHSEGGLTTIVEDGVNGKLFDLGTNPEVFADYIVSAFNDKELYRQLCLTSLKRYDEVLNWNVAGKRLSEIISKL